MSERKALAFQISLSTWFVYSCRRVSRLDITFSRPPIYQLYFVHNLLKHIIDASAIDTTLVFQVLVLLVFIEREKNVQRWSLVYSKAMLFESSCMSCLICRNTISLPDNSVISRYFFYPDRALTLKYQLFSKTVSSFGLQ